MHCVDKCFGNVFIFCPPYPTVIRHYYNFFTGFIINEDYFIPYTTL